MLKGAALTQAQLTGTGRAHSSPPHPQCTNLSGSVYLFPESGFGGDYSQLPDGARGETSKVPRAYNLKRHLLVTPGF